MSSRAGLAILAATALALGPGAGDTRAQTAPPARTPPPAVAAERPFTFPAHATARLENGLTVFVIEDHRQPLVSATLLIPSAGASSHPGTQAGLASMTAALLRQGTTGRSAQQIAEGIDRVGGSLSASAGADSTEASVTVVTSALETGFELLADIVQRPAFAAEEVERWRRQTLSGLQVAYSDPEYLRDVVGRRIAYGDHPYGFPADGIPDTARSLTREDAAGFYKERYTPAGAFLAIAGDIAPDAATALARKHFGAWKGVAVETPRPAAPRQERRIVVVDKPDAVQTQFGMVGAGVPRSHPDWLALAVANQVLGGDFNSRLNLRLRAKEGLTYGAGSALDSRRMAGILNLTSFTRTEETANAVRMTLEVIREFRKNPVTPAELAEATAFMSGVFGIQTETAGGVAARILTSALHGLPGDYWQTYRARVRKTSAAEVAAAVERHVVPDQLSIVAVGNASGFAKALDGLGAITIVPLATLDLTQPDLVAKQEAATGPDAAARGQALVKAAADAIGGAALLTSVKDATSSGTITLSTPNGEMKGTATATVVHPDKVRVSIALPIGEIVQVYDGAAAWLRMGEQPPADLPAPMQAEMQRSILMSGGIGLLREALEGRAEVAALEPGSLDGTKLDRISWKKGDLQMTVGFDAATHRIATVSYRGFTMQGPADSETRVGDYQKAANGLLVPMRAETYQNGQKVAEFVLTDWRFNTGVAADLFAKPQ